MPLPTMPPMDCATEIYAEPKVRHRTRKGDDLSSGRGSSILVEVAPSHEWFLASLAQATGGLSVTDEAVTEIRRSAMAPAGKVVALELLAALRAATAAVAREGVEVLPTDDGGMTFEIDASQSGKDLLIVIPDDGGVRYFTARAPGGFRRSGIITDEGALSALAAWLERSDAEFPSVGLDIG